MPAYIHGYSERETIRLNEQAEILENILHSGTSYNAGDVILEAGCGVGAQSVLLAKRNPQSKFIGIDRSKESVEQAKENIRNSGFSNCTFQVADIFQMPFQEETFDHVFVCFVLEHVEQPFDALLNLKKVMKKGASITIIEGDHESCLWYPRTEKSSAAWRSMIKAQQLIHHDPLIGRRLYPLLKESGFVIDRIEPRWVYADANTPELLNDVVNKIIVPMARTATEEAINNKLIDGQTWEEGIRDITNSGIPPKGTFFYSWFKAVAYKL